MAFASRCENIKIGVIETQYEAADWPDLIPLARHFAGGFFSVVRDTISSLLVPALVVSDGIDKAGFEI